MRHLNESSQTWTVSHSASRLAFPAMPPVTSFASENPTFCSCGPCFLLASVLCSNAAKTVTVPSLEAPASQSGLMGQAAEIKPASNTERSIGPWAQTCKIVQLLSQSYISHQGPILDAQRYYPQLSMKYSDVKVSKGCSLMVAHHCLVESGWWKMMQDRRMVTNWRVVMIVANSSGPKLWMVCTMNSWPADQAPSTMIHPSVLPSPSLRCSIRHPDPSYLSSMLHLLNLL